MGGPATYAGSWNVFFKSVFARYSIDSVQFDVLDLLKEFFSGGLDKYFINQGIAAIDNDHGAISVRCFQDFQVPAEVGLHDLSARDAIIAALTARDIVAGIHYPWPIHTMRGYACLGYGKGSLPVTEKAAAEIFSLPMYPSQADAEHDRVCAALRDILSGLGVQSWI